MNYSKIYNDFILSRRHLESSLVHYDTHHIVPRSLNGTNDSHNLIKLSYEDHLFAHSLLARIYGGSMWHALFLMINIKVKVTNRNFRLSYALSKQKHSELMASPKSPGHKKAISESLKGLPKSKTHRESLSIANKGKKLTDSQKQKISDTLKGRIITQEHKDKIRDSLKGKKLPEHVKAKISASKLGSKASEDTKSKMSASHTKRTLIVTTLQGNIKSYKSIKDFINAHGGQGTNIAKWCRENHMPISGKFKDLRFSYGH